MTNLAFLITRLRLRMVVWITAHVRSLQSLGRFWRLSYRIVARLTEGWMYIRSMRMGRIFTISVLGTGRTMRMLMSRGCRGLVLLKEILRWGIATKRQRPQERMSDGEHGGCA